MYCFTIRLGSFLKTSHLLILLKRTAAKEERLIKESVPDDAWRHS